MQQAGLNISPALRQSQGNVLPEVISVTSGKGGVGKSTLSVNLAILMRQMRRRVLVLDADIHLGNVDLIAGIRSKYTIADVVSNGVDINEVIIKGPGDIDVLPASSAVTELLDMEDLILRKLATAFGSIENQYDTIIVDTGAGIAQTVLSFVLGSDKVVLMVTPDPSSIADAYAVIKVIRHCRGAVPVVMFTNRVRSEEEGDSLFKKMNLMVQKFLSSYIEYGGSLVEDSVLQKSVKLQKPVVLSSPNGTTANALRVLNRKLVGIPVVDSSKRKDFFSRFISNRKVSLEGIS